MTAVLPETLVAQLTPIVLSAAEYDALPPNSRLELIDGVLSAMTPPSGRHQEVVTRLEAALDAVCPDGLRVVRELELRLADDHRRNPDLMVIRAAAYDLDGFSYRPPDVLVAIEVVSPGTETTDRLHKPAEYADVGIRHYWRIEPKPSLVVHTYRLGETGIYLESGLFSEGDTVAAPGLPWATIDVSRLTPRG